MKKNLGDKKKEKKFWLKKKILCCELLLENFRCFSKVRFFCLPPKVPNWIRALKFPSHFTEVLIFFDVAKKIDLFSDVLWGSLLWSLFLRQNLISKVPTARRVVFLSNFECEVIDKCVRGRGVEKKGHPPHLFPPGFSPVAVVKPCSSCGCLSALYMEGPGCVHRGPLGEGHPPR